MNEKSTHTKYTHNINKQTLAHNTFQCFGFEITVRIEEPSICSFPFISFQGKAVNRKMEVKDTNKNRNRDDDYGDDDDNDGGKYWKSEVGSTMRI